jgi:hypothetical protein
MYFRSQGNVASLLNTFVHKQASNSSTDHGGGKRRRVTVAPNLWFPRGPMFFYGLKVGDFIFIFVDYPSVNRAKAKNRACSLHRRFNGCARCRNICGSSRCRDDA